MLAIRARGPNDLFLDPRTPVPNTRPGYLLIRVLSVALNPSDYKRLAVFSEGSEPHTMGCDVAGLVVQDASEQKYEAGDRVAGLCYSMKPGDASSGAFGQYALLKGALSMRVPAHVSDAEAATIPVGVNFGGQALYQSLRLPLPVIVTSAKDRGTALPGPSVLIYGGTTATGMMALQLARLSGCRVLTTCSPRHFQLVKALGAHDAFDYHESERCGPAIRTATDNQLRHCLDCIATATSQRICAEALMSSLTDGEIEAEQNTSPPRYTASLPIAAGAFPRPHNVLHGWTSGYSSFGEGTHLSGALKEANDNDLEFAARWWKLAEALLAQDLIRLGPLVHVRGGGLQGVPRGLAELKSGSVSAGKLVYVL